MPRFHFNVFNGVASLDQDGSELPGFKEARVEAVRVAGEMLRDQPTGPSPDEDWRMEVTDDRGLILFRLDFTVMESAATLGTTSRR